jgi:Fe-S-cluster containining protein
MAAYHDGNGVCKHLVNRHCAIYDMRPMICDISRMYALFKSDVSWDTFVVENLKACLALARQFDDEKSRHRIYQLILKHGNE